jgi:hypothetical protein
MGQQTWFPFNLSAPEALLAPAAIGLALATAVGPVAFEIDLPDFHFGWRQVVAGAAVVAGIVGLVPLAIGVVNGRWRAPVEGFDTLLSFLEDEQAEGPFRVLWLGDPAVLPVAGRELRPGVGYGTSDEGLPLVRDRWVAAPAGPSTLIADVVEVAEARETSRVGRLLAPMGIRYIIVPEDAAPGMPGRHPVPDLVGVLAEQLDLVRVDVDPEIHVFRNAAWVPERAVVAAGTLPMDDEGGGYIELANAQPLVGATPILLDSREYATWTGELTAGDVYVAAAESEQWDLRLDDTDEPVERSRAYDWANGFRVGASGPATLRFDTPSWYQALLGVQQLLWLIALGVLRAAAIRRREAELI